MSNHHRQEQQSIGKSARNRIHAITGLQVQHLIAKLDILRPLFPSLPLLELVSETDYIPGEVSGGGGKHVLQECSILGNLRRIGAFDVPDAEHVHLTAIELGAGTGRLSERLQRVTKQEMTHVMIDRQEFTPSQCRDGRMRNRAKNSDSIRRIVGDIANFDVGDDCHEIEASERSRCFCMSKHLCGPACDLAIAALERVPVEWRPPFAFATCCHYLCTFDEFAGKKYWIELGLTEEDFEVAVAVSQWYSLKTSRDVNICKSDNIANDSASSVDHGFTSSFLDYRELISNASSALKVQMSPKAQTSAMIPSDEFERTFSNEDKARLGQNVKILLDMLRVAELQQLGYKAEMVLYTSKSIENRLLVGGIN
jgi:hypothetical protein